MHKLGIRAKLTTANLTYKFIKPLALAILRDLAFVKVYEPIHIDDVTTNFGVFYELLLVLDGDFFTLFAGVSAKILLRANASVAKGRVVCFYLAHLIRTPNANNAPMASRSIFFKHF